VFGQLRKLYRETKMKYMISSKEKPNNHPIHVVHTDLESFILYNDNSPVDIDSQLVENVEISEISGSVGEVLGPLDMVQGIHAWGMG
jgi:hypothetical protein